MGYPPSHQLNGDTPPPPMVYKVKTLPFVILRMRAVHIAKSRQSLYLITTCRNFFQTSIFGFSLNESYKLVNSDKPYSHEGTNFVEIVPHPFHWKFCLKQSDQYHGPLDLEWRCTAVCCLRRLTYESLYHFRVENFSKRSETRNILLLFWCSENDR